MGTSTECVDKLNGMLQGELSAIETYRQALEKTHDAHVKEELKACQACHAGRVDTLVQKVREMGGKVAENSGAWGAFAKLMEGGATIFGDKASIAVLEEVEDKGLDDYRRLLHDSSPDVNATAAALLPKQEGTHAKICALKKSLAA
jgi:uncharacterized protein (TIGR02284 family)